MNDETQTEIEFHVLAFCMAIPAAYWLVRTLIALLAG